MPRYYITIPINEKAIEKYVVERIKKYSNAELKERESSRFFCLEITSEMPCMRKIIVSVIASTITLFYKFKALKNSLKVAENAGIELYALMGALLGVELDEEMRAIEKSLINLNEFDVEGIWNFRLGDMVDSWVGLASLARKLLDNCESEEDIYELTAFLVNLDKSTPPKVKIETEPFEVFVDNIKLDIPNFTENENYNVIVSIMRERPLSIVVKNPETLDCELLETIRKLGTR